MLKNILNFSSPILKSIAFSTALLCVPHAYAGLTTLQGTSFSITYDDSLTGLFGTPALTGNTVYFTPTDFYALSANSSGFVLQRSTFNFVVNLKEGYQLDGYNFEERGDYLMNGGPGSVGVQRRSPVANANAQGPRQLGSSVGVGGQVRLFDAANPVNGAQTSSPLISNSNFTIADSASHDWAARTSVDLNNNLWETVRTYNVTLENILTAYTAPRSGNAFAFVEKKFAGILFDLSFDDSSGSSGGPVDPLPLPASVWFLLGGLISFVALARKYRLT